MPTRSPIPGLSMPGIRDTSDAGIQRNFQQILLWSQSVTPVLYAHGPVLYSPFFGGPQKPPSNIYMLQFTADFVVFDSSGVGAVVYPEPFPNGVGSIQVSISEAALGTCISFDNVSVTVTGFNVYLSTGAGAPVTGGHSIDWQAIGF